MFLRELAASAPVLTDGAWATELQCLGLSRADCADGWNLLEPDLVRELARSYVEAGSRVILTNTFRANAIILERWRLDSAVTEINLAGAQLSREAAGGQARVFGSIGPTGEHLATSHLLREAACNAFGEQTAALAAGGVDALLLETFSDIEEARLALHAARNTGLPVLVSFAFVSGVNRDRTRSGVSPEDVAHAMTEAGADGVGANCSDLESMLAVCRRMRASTHLPLWMKPNVERARLALQESFVSHVPSLADAGATFVGACCGSTPAVIRAMARTLAARTEVRHAHQGY